MKILVTGGAGFMGSSFIRHMMKTHPDLQMVCLDKLTYASDLSALSEVWDCDGFRFIKGDISDRGFVFDLFAEESFDAVVNFAAETHVDNSIKDSGPFFTSNILGTASLLDAVNAFHVRRFHQISTDEVYGDLPIESRESFNENSRLSPSNPYSASKASADMIALSYCRTYGTPVTISRSVNNYGPFQNAEKLIPLSITRAFNHQAVPVYAKGENVRSWIYVDDHSRVVESILLKGRAGEVYNISSGFEISNIEIVRYIIAKMGRSEDQITFVPDRPGHDRRYSLDNNKIVSELSLSSFVPFFKALDQTIDWYLRRLEDGRNCIL